MIIVLFCSLLLVVLIARMTISMHPISTYVKLFLFILLVINCSHLQHVIRDMLMNTHLLLAKVSSSRQQQTLSSVTISTIQLSTGRPEHTKERPATCTHVAFQKLIHELVLPYKEVQFTLVYTCCWYTLYIHYTYIHLHQPLSNCYSAFHIRLNYLNPLL